MPGTKPGTNEPGEMNHLNGSEALASWAHSRRPSIRRDHYFPLDTVFDGSDHRAVILVMLLMLIAYFAFRVLGEALDEGRLARMFFVEREPMARR